MAREGLLDCFITGFMEMRSDEQIHPNRPSDGSHPTGENVTGKMNP
jgi:hypothetical protein